MDTGLKRTSFRNGIRYTLTAIVGMTFWAVWFGFIPARLIKLNQQWGWPSVNHPAIQIGGLLLIMTAVIVCVYCGVLFGHLGKGTPVPGHPPKNLVAAGPYRFSRNPIYVAYVALLLGEFLLFGHVILLLYAMVTFLGFHVATLWIEEPILRRRFGEEYRNFSRDVPRWISLRRGRRLRD